MADVFTLQSGEIESNWEWIEPFLLRVDEPSWTTEDVKASLISGESQLWAAHENGAPLGVWLTKINKSHSRKWGLVWIAAGKPLEAGLDLFRRHTEPWLEAQGCRHVEITGRRGWKRVLPDYTERAVVFVKEF